MTAERNIRESIRLVRAELQRLIDSETSSFRAALFEQELLRLDELASNYGKQQTRFCRRGLADVLTTVALYSFECLDDKPGAGGAIIAIDQGETLRRISLVLTTAKVLIR